MANRYRGEVTVSVAGHAYTLRPAFHILCQLEERIGLSIPALLRRLGEKGLLASEILMILAIATRHDGSRAFDSAQVMGLPADAVDLHGLMPDIARFLRGGVALADGEDALDYADLLATAYHVLRLPPEDFWALTMPEFRALLRGKGQEDGLPDAAELQQLAQRFPDVTQQAGGSYGR